MANEKKSAMDKFLEAANKLSKDEKAELIASGYLVPAVASKNQVRTIGYRCAKCNRVPIHFLGDRFITPTGLEVESPKNLRPTDVPWTQPDMDPMKIDRRAPECCHCHRPLHIPNGKFADKFLVEIESWERSRDSAYARIAEKRRSHRSKVTGPMTNPDGSPINLNDAEATKIPHNIVDPSERQEISDAADEVGLGKIVFGNG